MKRFVEGDDRKQVALLPECVDDYIGQDNPVRIVDVFVDELDLTDAWLQRYHARNHRPPVLPPWRDAQDLYLRVSEPCTLQPAS